MWLDLSRCGGELFRLEQLTEVKLFIPAEWRALGAEIWLEEDEITTKRTLAKVEWVASLAQWSSQSDFYVPFTPRRNGSYAFRVTSNSKEFKVGYLNVEPMMKSDAPVTKIGSVVMQTVVSKLMGPFDKWDKIGDMALASGYNMIHFTPLQTLGHSDSAYCLKDQLNVDPRYGATNEQVAQYMDTLRKRGLMSCADLVLNHMASDSTWLAANPEATYNLSNSPHLIPAFLVDKEIIKVNQEIVNGEHPDLVEVKTEEDLARLGALLLARFKALKLEEFRQCSVETELARKKEVRENKSDLSFIDKTQTGRLCRPSNIDQHGDSNESDLRSTLEWLNEIEFDKMQAILEKAINGIIGTVRYERLDSSGPKKGPFSSSAPICTKYFECSSNVTDAEEIVKAEPERVWAHNGWVLDWNPMKCFIQPEHDIYLRRGLVPWADSVKLNYSNSPALWSLMESYATWTGANFDAVRIDNCHSTPLNVAEFILQTARRVNPRLLVIAELFTNSKTTDDLFVSRLGLDCLVRESLQVNNSWDYRYDGGITAFCGLDVNQTHSDELKPRSLLAGACLVDVTHDNDPSAIDRHCVADILPRAAICAFSNSSTGSTRGYDELVKEHINVVTETKRYLPMEKVKTNFFRVKQVLNKHHIYLCENGYDRCDYEIKDNVVVVRRRNLNTGEEMLLLAHTALSSDSGSRKPAMVELDTQLKNAKVELYSAIELYDQIPKEESDDFLTGLENQFKLEQDVSSQEDLARLKIHVHNSPKSDFIKTILSPGAIIVISGTNSTKPKLLDTAKLANIVSQLSLTDLNQILFSCEKEEQSNRPGNGCYDVPYHGPLPYAGFAGVYQLLRSIQSKRDHHALIDNIKHGTWLIEYLANRVQNSELRSFLRETVDDISTSVVLSNRAYYSIQFLSQVTKALIGGVLSKSPEWLCSTVYGRLNALSCVALFGSVTGAHWPLSPTSGMFESGSLCAGLPHFAEGIWRCWGRDTLISLRGSLLLPGRLDEAVAAVVAFGSSVRHGLVPNLLGEGKVARFNCRDATWFWLQSVIDLAQVKHDIWLEPVPTGFLNDEADFELTETTPTKTIEEVVYDILDRHGKGIHFIERNAGPKIDMNMDQRGFEVTACLDPETGFPTGGSIWNCGTWMDKMGESKRAGNCGVPSTPRHGAPVELVGLAHSVATMLAKWSTEGKLSRASFVLGGETVTWSAWADRIKANFERCFWNGEYYNDTYGGDDKRLRCNFPIALAVSPNLLSKENAKSALEVALEKLQSGLGMRTLSPDDPDYRPNYLSDDCDDPAIAKGANYHQGPSWMWPLGYFLRAALNFGLDKTTIISLISRQEDFLRKSDWLGLPELQNENGAHCPGSCPIQAWSHATMIEVLNDLSAK